MVDSLEHHSGCFRDPPPLYLGDRTSSKGAAVVSPATRRASCAKEPAEDSLAFGQGALELISCLPVWSP